MESTIGRHKKSKILQDGNLDRREAFIQISGQRRDFAGVLSRGD
jgi:hypothetical protein